MVGFGARLIGDCGLVGWVAVPEVIAAIASFAIGHPFGVRFPTLVVGVAVLVGAVEADVEIGIALLAGVAKPDPLAGC